MTRPIVTREQMLKRVARWKDLKPSARPLLDAALPEYVRDNYNVIGRGVTEDATMEVAIPDARDFHLTIARAEPGKGSALHAHKTLEVFVALTGNWSIIWGDQGENELMIGPWDTISVPTGIMRGFRNDSPVDAYLLTIIGGSDPGRVTWSDALLAAARAKGFDLDADGNIKTPDSK